jgi:hypothetical protein
MRESESSFGGELGMGVGVTFPGGVCDGGGETERREAVCALEPSITDVGVEDDVDGVIEAVV